MPKNILQNIKDNATLLLNITLVAGFIFLLINTLSTDKKINRNNIKLDSLIEIKSDSYTNPGKMSLALLFDHRTDSVKVTKYKKTFIFWIPEFSVGSVWNLKINGVKVKGYSNIRKEFERRVEREVGGFTLLKTYEGKEVAENNENGILCIVSTEKSNVDYNFIHNLLNEIFIQNSYYIVEFTH